MQKNEKCQNSLITSIIAAFIFFLILAVFGKSQAAGLFKPINENNSLISIKSHDVKVAINNGFAKTQVDQVFANNGGGELGIAIVESYDGGIIGGLAAFLLTSTAGTDGKNADDKTNTEGKVKQFRRPAVLSHALF